MCDAPDIYGGLFQEVGLLIQQLKPHQTHTAPCVHTRCILCAHSLHPVRILAVFLSVHHSGAVCVFEFALRQQSAAFQQCSQLHFNAASCSQLQSVKTQLHTAVNWLQSRTTISYNQQQSVRATVLTALSQYAQLCSHRTISEKLDESTRIHLDAP